MTDPSTTRRRLATACVLGTMIFATACQDTPKLFEPDAEWESPAVAALDATDAALLAVPIEDVLTRLLPSVGEREGALRHTLVELSAALPAANAATLQSRLSTARASAAALALDPADADALMLALEAIDHALRGNAIQ